MKQMPAFVRWIHMSTFSSFENICLEHILSLREKKNHIQLILLQNSISDSSTKRVRTDDGNTLKAENVPIKTKRKIEIMINLIIKHNHSICSLLPQFTKQEDLEKIQIKMYV